MENSSDDNTIKLINWLHALIEIIRAHNTPTWNLLVHTVNLKSAIIGFDNTYLSLSAKNGMNLKVTILPTIQVKNPDFYITSNSMSDIIAGIFTIDKAINHGHIFIRSELKDLLNFHYLVMNILADTPIKQDFLILWLDFKRNWKITESFEAYCIDNQNASFGYFVNDVSYGV